MARQLPRREARIDALRRLEDESSEEEDQLEDLPSDDAANFTNQNFDGDFADISNAEHELPEDDILDQEDLQQIGLLSEEESDEATNDQRVQEGLISASGIVWAQDRSRVGRQPQANIINGIQGFSRGLHPTSREEAFEVFFGDCIECVVRFTNLYGRRLAHAKSKEWKAVNTDEMCAFIGLHFLACALKAHHRKLEELWSERDGHPLFISTMSCLRFKQLKQALRFDDPLRRDATDPLAPIRTVVDSVNFQLKDKYSPGPFVTVDEQLVEFHGRVRFRRYIPTKPGKFGIEVYWAVDADNSFPLRCLVYIGEKTLSTEEKNVSSTIPEAIVCNVTQPFLRKGRNITGDNYFSSLRLCQRLNDNQTTYVGTLRQNKREIPPIARSTVGRQRGDTAHFYTTGITLCSFWDKASRPVLIISSQHGHQENQSSGKPDIVTFYNSTKAGVNNLDKVNRTYFSKRKCRRWPYSVFFSLADNICYAALLLWNSEGNSDTHYKFKRDLAYGLCIPLIRRRATICNLRKSVKDAIGRLGIQLVTPLTPSVNERSQGRCYFCPRGPDRKQRKKCCACQRFICAAHGHTQTLCQNCLP